MLNRIRELVSVDNLTEFLDSVKRKQSMYKSEMQIGDKQIKITESSHLTMKDDRLYIKEIKTVVADEYFSVAFDNGEFIHYDYYGKAYLSLDPRSKLYKVRLSRYDITNII